MAAVASVRRCKGTTLLWVVFLCCAVLPGCVRRRLTIRSNPSGALVSINNQEIGPTPVSVAFLYYGVYSIRVEKSGYESETVHKKISPPPYEYPVIDFFSENLWPWELRDERIVEFQLRPQVIVPTEQLVRNAEDLRGNAGQGFFTPLAPPQLTPRDAAPYAAPSSAPSYPIVPPTTPPPTTPPNTPTFRSRTLPPAVLGPPATAPQTPPFAPRY